MSVSLRQRRATRLRSYAGSVLNEEERQEVERALAESDRSAGIVLLPEGREDDGSGIYDEGLVDLAEDLRGDGVAVSWADGPGKRALRSKRSAGDIIWGAIAGFPVSIMAAAAYAKLVQWFGRSPQSEGRVRLEVVQETRGPDGAITGTWRTFEGTGADVAELMKASPPSALPSSSDD